jgi:hypothetical protein
MTGPVAAYFDAAIATYEREPPANDYQRGHLDALKVARAELAPLPAQPIPMLLFCPNCGQQHIDKPDPDDNWENPPHTSHKCVGLNGCGCIWRPADVPTAGVDGIATRGKSDTWRPDWGVIGYGYFEGEPSLCEPCGKPVLRGQFVNLYDDIGTAHADCDAPFAKPKEATIA